MNKLKSIIKLLKIKHYVKNIVVFIPLVFSLKFLEFNATFEAIIAFIAFDLIASAVYIFNDILDVENDKLHPVKKFRPIASGEISIPLAWILFVLFVIASFVVAFAVNKLVFLSIFLYLILNIWYSLQLKSLPIIDAVGIALGFILRILAGCSAILVVPSPLVILLTFFTSMFFTFSKRKLEYKLLDDKGLCRKSIKGYNETLLNQFVMTNAVLSIAFYITYMLDSTTIQRTGSEYLFITVIPFTIIIYRLVFKIYTANDNDDPAEFFYNDKTLKILIFTYLIILFIVLYKF